jgi:hypothetical protein
VLDILGMIQTWLEDQTEIAAKEGRPQFGDIS